MMGPGCDPGHGGHAPAPPGLPPVSPSSLRTPVTALGLPSLTPPGPLLGGQCLQRSIFLRVRGWDMDPFPGPSLTPAEDMGPGGVAGRQQDACGRPGPAPRLLGPAGILGAAPHPEPRSRLRSHQASTRPVWCCPRVEETVGEQPLTGSSGTSTQEEGAEPMMCQVTGTSKPPEDAAGIHGESEWAPSPTRPGSLCPAWA